VVQIATDYSQGMAENDIAKRGATASEGQKTKVLL